ncbi:hypothetical protein [Floricoccus tropicus]|uniref:hypothetical protein n=1 Tax=Floricoccus tropicus TaxID=1859473 RepID=UPI001300D4DE|nr:hypothetical protein [Floricoccus tropicus]
MKLSRVNSSVSMASVHNSYELFLATTLSFDVDKTDATKVASFNRNSNGTEFTRFIVP